MPFSCALCGQGLYRWYYGMRAPMCAGCSKKEGPVRHPSQWDAEASFSAAARDVWNSYQAADGGCELAAT